jgi:hypothetical protein
VAAIWVERSLQIFAFTHDSPKGPWLVMRAHPMHLISSMDSSWWLIVTCARRLGMFTEIGNPADLCGRDSKLGLGVIVFTRDNVGRNIRVILYFSSCSQLA